MIEFIVLSKHNMSSPSFFDKFSELTRKSTSASSVLNSKIPLMVTLVRTIRRIAPDKCVLFEEYLRKIGLISGYHTSKFIDNNVIRSREEFETFLTKENRMMFVALSEDKIVGILCMEPAKETGMAYLHTLHVDPSYRRSGIATSLCAKALDIAKDRKYTGALAVVLKESLGLFTRLGFKGNVLNKGNYTYFLSRSL